MVSHQSLELHCQVAPCLLTLLHSESNLNISVGGEKTYAKLYRFVFLLVMEESWDSSKSPPTFGNYQMWNFDYHILVFHGGFIFICLMTLNLFFHVCVEYVCVVGMGRICIRRQEVDIGRLPWSLRHELSATLLFRLVFS